MDRAPDFESVGCGFESRRGRHYFSIPGRVQNMPPLEPETFIIPTLLARLERISADSHSAHLASGIRGALLRAQEQIEAGHPVNEHRLRQLIEQGFRILENAAREKIGRDISTGRCADPPRGR